MDTRSKIKHIQNITHKCYGYLLDGDDLMDLWRLYIGKPRMIRSRFEAMQSWPPDCDVRHILIAIKELV